MRGMNGFTLIELLVTLAVVAIVVTIGMPSYSALMRHYQMTSAVNGMVSLLTLARVEAVRRQTLITVCPTADEQTCATDWSLPVMIFADPNRDETRGSDEPLLRVLSPSSTTSWTANLNYFQYRANGMVNGTMGSLFYCHESRELEYARRLVINLGGRVRLSQDRNRDGIHEEINGC